MTETLLTIEAQQRLPEPVARYLRRALRDCAHPIVNVQLRQHGRLRTDPLSKRWLRFSARHEAAPLRTEFSWSARVRLLPLVHISVRDSYIAGRGAGMVKLLSAWTMASRAGEEAMNSGSLHRYLAEAVWYPTALLPSDALEWTPIGADRALATLSHAGTTVSLEFRFGRDDEVTGIYSPGRWGLFRGVYKQVPWEGHFRDYRLADGIYLPFEGEVGWYLSGLWHSVWEGHIEAPEYQFGTAGVLRNRT